MAVINHNDNAYFTAAEPLIIDGGQAPFSEAELSAEIEDAERQAKEFLAKRKEGKKGFIRQEFDDLDREITAQVQKHLEKRRLQKSRAKA